MAPFYLERPPITRDELYWCVRSMWGVHLPRHTCGDPGHTSPFDAFADAYFNDTGHSSVLWHGSRGFSGKSFMLSVLGLTKAFLTGSDVNLLGGSFAQSTNIHEHMRSALHYKDAPRYMLEKEGNNLIQLTNNARIRPLTASQNTVRGPHPATLLCMAEGTLVDTQSGCVPIEDIKIGSVVFGMLDDETVLTKVLNKKDSGFQKTVVVLIDGEDGAIRCTPEHKIYTERGWIEARHLETGDRVKSFYRDYELQAVTSVEDGSYANTWDITTTTGNFFADGYLVHNCDEIDEMDLPILDAALGQPMPQENYLGEVIQPFALLCSTWQKPNGTFTEIVRRFEDRGIPIVRWCYKCTANTTDGWLSQETIDAKKREIPVEMFRTEYDLGEPAIGNRAFDPDSVEYVFDHPFEPVFKKEQKDYEEYVFAKPLSHGTYVAAADWGKEQDYTVISVMRADVQPAELVYWMRVNRRPYPVMIGYFNKAINTYNASAIHDGTGLGNVVNDYVDVRARSFIMTGAARSNMISEYVSAVENAKVAYPKFKTNYLAHKYARVGDLYDTSKDFHLPDEVCALALAWKLIKKAGLGAGNPIAVIRDMTPTRGEAEFLPQWKRTPEVVSQDKTISVVTKDSPGSLSLLV